MLIRVIRDALCCFGCTISVSRPYRLLLICRWVGPCVFLACACTATSPFGGASGSLEHSPPAHPDETPTPPRTVAEALRTSPDEVSAANARGDVALVSVPGFFPHHEVNADVSGCVGLSILEA